MNPISFFRLLPAVVLVSTFCPVATAQLITKRITVQPIQVTSANGAIVGNASQTLWEAEADKIFAQAGIDIRFLTWQTYASDTYINPTAFTTGTGSIGALAALTGQTWPDASSNTLRIWFVNQIGGTSSNLGLTLQSSVNTFDVPTQRNGVLIANSAFSFGFVDTIAHEIGHAVGLYHDDVTKDLDVGTQPGKNLMVTNPSPGFPTSIANIFPDGNDLGQLTALQIAEMDKFRIVVDLPLNEQYTYTAVPEPAHFAALAGALALAAGLYRRRRSAGK